MQLETEDGKSHVNPIIMKTTDTKTGEATQEGGVDGEARADEGRTGSHGVLEAEE